MQNNKDIDRLFQERLKNLDAKPSSKVWTNIEAKLTKKKRRVLPFWWLGSGVAAILILTFLVFPFDTNNKDVKKDSLKEIITVAPKNKENTIDTQTIKKEVLKEYKTDETVIKPKKNNVINPSKILIAKEEKSHTKKQKSTINKTGNKEVTIFKKDDKTIKNKKTEIIKKNIETIKKDTFLIAKNEDKKAAKKDIQKLVDENLKPKKEQKLNKKNWSIATVFGVVNSNSFTNTSPLNPNLSGSTKGKNSISYGLQVGYQINKKWAVQTGIHLQEISFENRQIAVILSSSNLSSIAFNSNQNFAFENSNSTQSLDANSAPLKAVTLNGNLTQSYSYYEIPLEIKYNLIEKSKFSTHIVGGFSTLFLKENQILLSTPTLNREGKADNLNNLNFSGNIGLDLNYDINKDFSLYFNPMLKTQLKTFTENANNFKPYFLGYYIGVHYQF